jgi:hypothetical protein
MQSVLQATAIKMPMRLRSANLTPMKPGDDRPDRSSGFKIMIFSGGEPLLRPDIFELVAHAAGRGLRPVFGTNGI